MKTMLAEDTKPLTGAFVESLVRNNKEIKRDRAQSIAEDLEMVYRRSIEDMEIKLKKLKKDRENMLDLSPSNKMMIITAGEFDATEFTKKDQELGIAIREMKIRINEARERYEVLFGDTVVATTSTTTPTDGTETD